MTHVSRILGVTALGLAMLTAGPAIAQTQSGQAEQMPASTQSTQNISQQQLQNFADASAKISDIRQSAMKNMQQASDQEKRTRIRKQAQKNMLAAIKESGLTLQEYNRIGKAVRANPELAQQLKKLR